MVRNCHLFTVKRRQRNDAASFWLGVDGSHFCARGPMILSVVDVLTVEWSCHQSLFWQPPTSQASHLCPISLANHTPISLHFSARAHSVQSAAFLLHRIIDVSPQATNSPHHLLIITLICTHKQYKHSNRFKHKTYWWVLMLLDSVRAERTLNTIQNKYSY